MYGTQCSDSIFLDNFRSLQQCEGYKYFCNALNGCTFLFLIEFSFLFSLTGRPLKFGSYFFKWETISCSDNMRYFWNSENIT